MVGFVFEWGLENGGSFSFEAQGGSAQVFGEAEHFYGLVHVEEEHSKTNKVPIEPRFDHTVTILNSFSTKKTTMMDDDQDDDHDDQMITTMRATTRHGAHDHAVIPT